MTMIKNSVIECFILLLCACTVFIYVKANQTKRKELNSISNKIYLFVTAPLIYKKTAKAIETAYNTLEISH